MNEPSENKLEIMLDLKLVPRTRFHDSQIPRLNKALTRMFDHLREDGFPLESAVWDVRQVLARPGDSRGSGMWPEWGQLEDDQEPKISQEGTVV